MLVSGHNISTTEVESALVSHPKVAEAAVVGATDPTTGQAIVAFVILRGRRRAGDEGDALVKELRDHVAKTLGPIAKPRQIMLVPELPKTRSGKIMRRLLRDVAENRSLGDVTTLQDSTVMDLISAGLQTHRHARTDRESQGRTSSPRRGATPSGPGMPGNWRLGTDRTPGPMLAPCRRRGRVVLCCSTGRGPTGSSSPTAPGSTWWRPAPGRWCCCCTASRSSGGPGSTRSAALADAGLPGGRGRPARLRRQRQAAAGLRRLHHGGRRHRADPGARRARRDRSSAPATAGWSPGPTAAFHPRSVRRLVVLAAAASAAAAGGAAHRPARAVAPRSGRCSQFQLPRYEHVLTRDDAAAGGRVTCAGGPARPGSAPADFADYERAVPARRCRSRRRPSARWRRTGGASAALLRLHGHRFRQASCGRRSWRPTLQLHGALDPAVLPATALGLGPVCDRGVRVAPARPTSATSPTRRRRTWSPARSSAGRSRSGGRRHVRTRATASSWPTGSRAVSGQPAQKGAPTRAQTFVIVGAPHSGRRLSERRLQWRTWTATSLIPRSAVDLRRRRCRAGTAPAASRCPARRRTGTARPAR